MMHKLFQDDAMRRTRIAGVGHHVPERVVTNRDLESLMETSDEWIQERTGIRERRFVEPGTGSAALGVEAAKRAIADAGWKADDVQFIVFATLSPDLYFPGNGVLLQAALDLRDIGAIDIRNQCTGFVYGLSVGDALVRMGMYDRVLLVGAEVHSVVLRMNTEGRDTAVLFGDGAGAVCLEVTDGADGGAILGHRLHADGRYANELTIQRPGSAAHPWLTPEMIDEGLTSPHMNGREVFKNAVTRFPEVIGEVLADEGMSADDVDLVIPHQANERITEAVRKRLGLSADRVYSNIAKYGNTTAASIPIALSEAVGEGKVQRGSVVCLAAFGSGFTWGASLLRY
jgi:3-oxoacyl-[acyl-carrier-protein] synthase-3